LTKPLKWAIIVLSIALVTLVIFLCGQFFGRTLGALPTVVIWAVLYAIGWKWTSSPKSEPEEDQQDDTPDSE